jgi:putative peptidoglycan lipid II flippase
MANARGHFFVPALGSVILNLVMIASVLWLAPRMGSTLGRQIRGLAIGVVVAGVVQAFFQVPSLNHEGFRFRWVSPWRDPTVREVVRKMLPGSIGVAAFQINVLVTYFFSYWFDESIVSTFNYAVRLMELPQGMFGISLATYLLPTLSGLAGQKKFPEFRRTLGQGLGHLALANLLAAAIALALAEPIVRLLFERGKFDAHTTYRVAMALKCLAPGLLMFSMNNILARAFYALSDVKTPMKISIFCLGVNLAFSLWLIRSYREMGLGVANTLSASFNMLLLTYALRRKLVRLGLTELTRSLLVLVPSAALAGLTAAGLAALWGNHLGHASLPLKLGQVFVPAAGAGLFYWVLALAFKVPAAREMTGLFLHRFGKTTAPAA